MQAPIIVNAKKQSAEKLDAKKYALMVCDNTSHMYPNIV